MRTRLFQLSYHPPLRSESDPPVDPAALVSQLVEVAAALAPGSLLPGEPRIQILACGQAAAAGPHHDSVVTVLVAVPDDHHSASGPPATLPDGQTVTSDQQTVPLLDQTIRQHAPLLEQHVLTWSTPSS
jgi:hypothetical protein